MDIGNLNTVADDLRAMGKKVQEYRLMKNITQQEVADRAGIAITTVSRFEQGDNVSLANFVSIMKALHYPIQFHHLAPTEKPQTVQEAIRQKRSIRSRARKVKS